MVVLAVAVAPNAQATTVTPVPDTVATWGEQGEGRLGNGLVDPAVVTSPIGVVQAGVLAGKTLTDVSIGSRNTCVVASGSVYCWGSGSFGMLGLDPLYTPPSPVPVAIDTAGVLAGKTVTQVAVSVEHGCLIASGAAYCWGSNSRGELGIGSSDPAWGLVPVDTTGVLAGKTVTAIAVGEETSCAVASGSVYCWGDGENGLLGHYTFDVTVPTAIEDGGVLSGLAITDVAIGDDLTGTYYAAPAAFCVVASARVYCWGDSSYGQAGTLSVLQPVTAVGVTGPMAGVDITSITVGKQHACALGGGHAYCWGLNFYGQLGNGVTVLPENDPTPYVPVMVSEVNGFASSPITALVAGRYGTCGVSSGQMYCWGNSYMGLHSAPTLADPGVVTAQGQVLDLALSATGGAVLARVDSTAPTAWTTAPTAVSTLATSVPFAWTGSDGTGSGIAAYQAVTQRSTARTLPGAAVTGSSTTATTASPTIGAGETVCLAVRATDVSGNAGVASPYRCVSRPLDQTVLVHDSRWTTSKSSSFYGGSVLSSKTHNAYATYSGVKSVTRVQLVARTGSTMGAVGIYIGTTRVAYFSLWSSTARNRVVFTSNRFAAKSGTIKIIVTSVTGRTVSIDGLGATR